MEKQERARNWHCTISRGERENLVSGFTTAIDLSKRWVVVVYYITSPLDLVVRQHIYRLSLTNKEKRRSKDLREKPAVGGIFKNTKKKKKKEKKIRELDFPKVALSRRAQLHGQVTWGQRLEYRTADFRFFISLSFLFRKRIGKQNKILQQLDKQFFNVIQNHVSQRRLTVDASL